VHYGAQAEARVPPPAPRTGKKVAVVGSGPAGLTAAYYLSRVKGHGVTIFEELPVAGGMMRTGIPRYRLPRRGLEHDLAIVRNAGVEIRTGARVHSVEGLKEKGFDAVFLALGAHNSWDLGVEGEGLEGVLDCVKFLRDVSLGKKPNPGRRVAVVGGGNSAMDAARTALRLGAREVVILYRRSRDEMPADQREIEEALAEGAKLETLTLPVAIRKSPNGLAMVCKRMRLGATDEGGRRRPEPIEGSEFELHFDSVISAIGQFPAIPPELGVDVQMKSHLIQAKRFAGDIHPGRVRRRGRRVRSSLSCRRHCSRAPRG